MEFFHKQSTINFMAKRKLTASLSLFLCIASLSLLGLRGLNFGLDFTGGTQLEVRYPAEVDLELVREKLESSSFEAKISYFGSTQDLLIRLPNKAKENEAILGKQVLAILAQEHPGVELRRVEFVGAEVGEQLTEQGGLAVLVAILATMAYIALRFEYRLAVSAAVALLHDPIVILGFFALTQLEFDLASLASILAVLGYSLNDTIVVFDRVRENFRKIRKGSNEEIMDLSINQTLSRTLMTSFLTALVVLALLLFGGSSLRGFSSAFLVGIVIGTYSSIYVAGTLALSLGLSRHDLLVAVRKEAEDEHDEA
jgi:preprotein translocase subunit SecF